jgi:hypothetical protein
LADTGDQSRRQARQPTHTGLEIKKPPLFLIFPRKIGKSVKAEA